MQITRVVSNMSQRMRVLSIQSSVVHGYVGNSMASVPFHLLGAHFDAINTISLANRPGLGLMKAKDQLGYEMAAADLRKMTSALEANGLLHKYDVVMSGYTNRADVLETIAESVRRIKGSNPSSLYVCDPVLGDGRPHNAPTPLF